MKISKARFGRAETAQGEGPRRASAMLESTKAWLGGVARRRGSAVLETSMLWFGRAEKVQVLSTAVLKRYNAWFGNDSAVLKPSKAWFGRAGKV